MWGFPDGSDGKASACSAGDPGSTPGLGRSLGEGNGNPLQYSCLENPTDGGVWQSTVHGVTKSRTWLSDFIHFLQEPQVILAVGNKLIDSVVDITLLCKLNAQITFGFPDGSDGKASAYNAGDPGPIPGLGRPPGEGNGNPLQYSCLGNPMDRGASHGL